MTITVCYISENEDSVGALVARSSLDGTFTYEPMIGQLEDGTGVSGQCDLVVLPQRLAAARETHKREALLSLRQQTKLACPPELDDRLHYVVELL